MKNTAILTILVLNLFLLAASRPCRAQAAPLPGDEYLRVTYDANSTAAPTPATTGDSSVDDLASPADPRGEPTQGGTAQSGANQGGTTQDVTGKDDQWHLSVSPYLWFGGTHGTLGAFGHDVGFKASAGDLLSHFRFGIMGAVEARRNRLLLSTDLMVVRLQDDHALPLPGFGADSATLKATSFILTPKVGVRLLDGKMIKADALAGIRYWHFGETLNFNPGTLGLNFSKSQDWVDPGVGGRITATLAPKVVFTMGGDVGGWDTGSHQEYQAAGLLGYKVTPKMTLQGGYRYMYLDYRKSGPASPVVNVAISGVMFGVTLNLK